MPRGRARRRSSRWGSQRRPSRISTVVTSSTEICVSARSGAENHRKVMQVARPAPPSSVSAAMRWYLACHAAATADTAPKIHSSTKAGESGSAPRWPSCRPCNHRGKAPASKAAPTSQSICHCRRRVLRAWRPWRAAADSSASSPSKMRCPSKRPMRGASTRRPCRCARPSSRYSSVPPASASRLITMGALKPCHTARLNAGRSPPTTGRAAAARLAPTVVAGRTPTSRQVSTSSSTGTRIQRGGSCGVCGRSVAGGPKNTSTVKRSE